MYVRRRIRRGWKVSEIAVPRACVHTQREIGIRQPLFVVGRIGLEGQLLFIVKSP
jgi:hypothetical protein